MIAPPALAAKARIKATTYLQMFRVKLRQGRTEASTAGVSELGSGSQTITYFGDMTLTAFGHMQI